MRKALVVSQRGKLLKGLLGVVGDAELDIEVRPDLLSALSDLRRLRPQLVVLDVVTFDATDRGLLPSVRSQSPRSAILAVVPAMDSALVREATRAGAHALVLDPFDLAETKAVVERLLAGTATRGGEQESIDQLATFLKGLAHEILNPLTSISGILQILMHEGGQGDERAPRYRTMFQAVDRIQKVLRELEYFVRARKPQRRLVDSGKLVRDVSERLRRAEPPLSVSFDAPESAPAILVDQEQMALALRHLSTFAAGRDQRGPVDLKLNTPSGRVEIEVHGSTPVALGERPEQLLVPYQDVHASGRSGNLELAAAHGIVRSHKGTLEVEAPSEGGVRFRVTLPLPKSTGEDVAQPGSVQGDG
jgi:signal transduction histidine kinase